MRYKVGDRVRIVSERVRGMSTGGGMDRWLGRIMTISEIVESSNYPYRMEEDGGTWAWHDDMIAGLAEPELTAAEVLRISNEICQTYSDDGRNCDMDCPFCKGMSCREWMANHPTEAISICDRWKADHEKKEPEIETVDICRIIEILPDGSKYCVREEDIKPDPELPYGSERLAVEEMLKSYCMEHKGQFIAVQEVVSRVK